MMSQVGLVGFEIVPRLIEQSGCETRVVGYICMMAGRVYNAPSWPSAINSTSRLLGFRRVYSGLRKNATCYLKYVRQCIPACDECSTGARIIVLDVLCDKLSAYNIAYIQNVKWLRFECLVSRIETSYSSHS